MEYPTIRKRRTREFVPKIHSQFATFFRNRCGNTSPPLMFVDGSTQFLLQQNSNVACKCLYTDLFGFSSTITEIFRFIHTECFQFNYVPDVFNYFRSPPMSRYKGSSSAVLVLWDIIFHSIHLFHLNAHSWRCVTS